MHSRQTSSGTRCEIRWWLLALFVALPAVATVACDERDLDGGDGDSDADTDVDGDSDTDTDVDGDSDGDGPPEIEGVIHVEESCSGFSACGGALAGTAWDYSDLCVAESEIFGDELDICAGAAVEWVEGTISGMVSFTAARVRRSGSGEVETMVTLPATCTAAIGGCGVVEMLLAGEAGLDASCQDGGAGGCACAIVTTVTIDQEDSYFIDGNVLYTGDGRAFEYCVAGDALSYVELGDDPELGIAELSRR